MEHLKFEWDENKNTINKNKHNIAFEEAQTVFYDDMIFREVSNMREEYDFTNARRNPYMKKEKQQITINLDKEVDCTANKREL